MKTYEDYKIENETGEFISETFKTTVEELNKLEGWNFPTGNGYENDTEITIGINNSKGELQASWYDGFDTESMDIENAIDAIEKLTK